MLFIKFVFTLYSGANSSDYTESETLIWSEKLLAPIYMTKQHIKHDMIELFNDLGLFHFYLRQVTFYKKRTTIMVELNDQHVGGVERRVCK